MDDLAQYSPRRRNTRERAEPAFLFTSPLVFKLVPAVPLERPRSIPRAMRLRFG
jgi:hypothetical protein